MLLAVEANEKVLKLVYNIDGEVPDYVIGDSYRLRQVALNLVDNVIKFTEHGVFRVSIKRADHKNCAPGECAFEFSVSDTGIGIKPSMLNMILTNSSRQMVLRLGVLAVLDWASQFRKDLLIS